MKLTSLEKSTFRVFLTKEENELAFGFWYYRPEELQADLQQLLYGNHEGVKLEIAINTVSYTANIIIYNKNNDYLTSLIDLNTDRISTDLLLEKGNNSIILQLIRENVGTADIIPITKDSAVGIRVINYQVEKL